MPGRKKKQQDDEDILEKNMKFGVSNDDDDDDNDNLVEIINNHIYFYSDVNNKSAFELTKAFEKVKLQLMTLKSKFGMEPIIHLHINTYGGCLFSGFCIVDAIRKLQQEDIEVYTYCEGKVASAGTLISVVGNKRFISKNSLMLIHQLSSMFWGKFHEIEDDWENCNMLMKKLKAIYKENTKFKKKDLDKLLKRDLWLESKKCLEFGLIDEII